MPPHASKRDELASTHLPPENDYACSKAKLTQALHLRLWHLAQKNGPAVCSNLRPIPAALPPTAACSVERPLPKRKRTGTMAGPSVCSHLAFGNDWRRRGFALAVVSVSVLCAAGDAKQSQRRRRQ